MPMIEGSIASDAGWQPARIDLEAGRIAAISPAHACGRHIVPGFIDTHCHGGGGRDVMEAGDAVLVAAETHARHGTTGFLATTMTAPVAEIATALDAVAVAVAEPQRRGAAILGVHLEGPFISPDRLGAQPPFAIPGDLALMAEWLARAPIRVVTLAPEADPTRALAMSLQRRGVRVQLGHSSCDYEVGRAWLEDGTVGITHLFNAMTPLHHRAPGLAGAALAHALEAELIVDGIHVVAGAMRAALRAIPKLHAITDATAAAGMPDGVYRLGRQTVRRTGDSVALADGSLAGSCLTMDAAFRNLLDLGLSPADAVRRTATIAADRLGLPDRGRLAVGCRADLVVLDDNLRVIDVLCEGRSLLG